MVIGIICALLTGVVWCFVGIFYSHIGRRKLNIYDISVLVNLAALLLMSILAGAKIQHSDIEWSLDWRSAAFVSAAGGVNFTGSLILQRALCMLREAERFVGTGTIGADYPFYYDFADFRRRNEYGENCRHSIDCGRNVCSQPQKKTIRTTLDTQIRLGVLVWH